MKFRNYEKTNNKKIKNELLNIFLEIKKKKKFEIIILQKKE